MDWLTKTGVREDNTPMKIVINDDVCIGCGLCASIAEDFFQIDEEIQRLYTEKEEQYKKNESKVVLMELDLKISELEEKLEKIEAATKSQKEALEDYQVRLEVMKRKPVFDRMLEKIKQLT